MKVTFGEITPDEYARQVLKVESKSEYSHYRVAKELNIGFGKHGDKSTARRLKKYKKGKITDAALMKFLVNNAMNSYFENGDRAYDGYKKQGQNARERYLKSQEDFKNDTIRPEPKKNYQCDCLPYPKFNPTEHIDYNKY